VPVCLGLVRGRLRLRECVFVCWCVVFIFLWMGACVQNAWEK